MRHSGIVPSFHNSQIIDQAVNRLVKVRNLPFRSIEKLVTKITLVCALEEKQGGQIAFFYYILADLAYIWLFRPDLYNDLKSGECNYSDIKECLRLVDNELCPEHTHFLAFEASLWRHFCLETSGEEAAYMGSGLSHYGGELPTITFQRIAQETMETVFSL
jgi:hypothetical protein